MKKFPALKSLAIAICSASTKEQAFAACAFQLQVSDGWQQIFPAGVFRARDGRPEDVPSGNWQLDAGIAAAVIQRFQQRVNDAVVDYEHQTLNSEHNGEPAPAAGWIKELEWREGAGMFARVEWTAKARQMIKDGEYRYLSPVFTYDPHTGAVISLEMAAVTNYPGLDGMQALAAMRKTKTNPEDNPVKLLEMLRALLGLKADADEDAVVAALKKNLADGEAHQKALATLRKQLDLKDDAGEDDIKSALAALKQGGDGGNPDPSKFVPLKVVEDLRGEVAALTAQITGDQVETLVSDALEDGRLLKAQEEWARDLGKKDVAALKKYLETAQPIAALRKTQTNGDERPAGEYGLTESELAVCRNMGMDPAEYAKSKPGYKAPAEGGK